MTRRLTKEDFLSGPGLDAFLRPFPPEQRKLFKTILTNTLVSMSDEAFDNFVDTLQRVIADPDIALERQSANVFQ